VLISDKDKTKVGDEVTQLRRELAQIKGQVGDNERIWSGFRYIEISLIGTRTLWELLEALTQNFPRAFPQIDCVTLACFDEEYELVRLLEGASGKEGGHPAFVRLERDAMAEIFSDFRRPMLGQCNQAIQSLLFPRYQKTLGSVAIAPLILQNRLLGCMCQGSRLSGHFPADAATDMLEHLAAVAAVCIDNTINHERLQRDGLTDPLTGLANRRFFERRLVEEIERWRRHSKTLSCLLVDVDLFKGVNDRYGHQVGDEVLKRISAALGKDLRASDVLARYGGEEFVLLLPETIPQHAMEIAERLREQVEVLRHNDIQDLPVTVSIGVSGLPDQRTLAPTLAGDWLLRQADTALYQAKNSGRNTVCLARTRAGLN